MLAAGAGEEWAEADNGAGRIDCFDGKVPRGRRFLFFFFFFFTYLLARVVWSWQQVATLLGVSSVSVCTCRRAANDHPSRSVLV